MQGQVKLQFVMHAFLINKARFEKVNFYMKLWNNIEHHCHMYERKVTIYIKGMIYMNMD
jgi:hypothetical protein